MSELMESTGAMAVLVTSGFLLGLGFWGAFLLLVRLILDKKDRKEGGQ